MSKLTLHFTTMLPWGPAIVRAGAFAWAKWVNPSGGDLWPGQRTIGRLLYEDSDGWWQQGAAGADRWYGYMRPKIAACPWVAVWELWNEPVTKHDDAAVYRANRLRLAEATIRAVELMHRDGFRVATGSFATGTPRLAAYDAGQTDLVELRPVFEAGDYWSLHQYGYCSMQNLAPYHALRHRQLLAELRGMGVQARPILVTETGIEPGGWRVHHPWEQFQAQLDWYSGELDRDAEVLCAALFKSGGWGFEGFEIGEGEATWLSAYVRSHPSPTTVQPPPPPPPPASAIPPTITAPGVTYRVPVQAPRMYSSPRAPLGVPLWLIVHDSEGPAGASFWWWCSPNNPYRSSAHDLVDRAGVVWRCVPYNLAAHHAGGESARIPGAPLGKTAGTSNTNHVSIGVELEADPAPMAPGYTEPQLDVAVAHLGELVRELGIPRERVLRHADVDPANRTDPRGLDWEAFLDAVYGVVKPQPAGLPEHEPATDAPTLASKARWWLEEEQRAQEAGNEARANDIRLSLIKLMYRLEAALKAT